MIFSFCGFPHTDPTPKRPQMASVQGICLL